ncbi:MAG: UDP-N-acetylmuramoyl-tripeptide--D-alanyl-D-alanine ligase [Pseudomonadota bacterium]
MRLTITWLVEAIQGRLLQGGPEGGYPGISTDSRSIRPGEFFWALKGERFDGHDFLREVRDKGASGVVIERGRAVPEMNEAMVIIEVDDTLWALGECAAHYRRLYDIPIVAVTGSNGKTTTKEMIVSILSTKRQVLKTKGNLNNLIGLPLSLLNLSPKHDVGVVELGMNRRGEIARLTEIVNPTVGVITNIGPVHLEYLKSVEAVAEAKGELFQKMSSQSTAVINNDDPMVEKMSRDFPGEKVTFGMKHPADVGAENIKSMGFEGITFDLRIREKTFPIYFPIIGEHNIMNALAAAAAVMAVGEDPEMIVRGLEHFTNLSLRQEVVTVGDTITLINDAYNANPISMQTALKTFSQLKGSARGIVVLGDMLELGGWSIRLHRELGKQVAQSGINHLLLLGNYASAVREGAIAGGISPECIVIGKDHQQLTDILEGLLNQGDWVLVKGSRKMEMEKIVKKFIKDENKSHVVKKKVQENGDG